MILTQCAVCATDLGLTLGKKCGRCSTRYCGADCQVQHWKEGGRDKLCKKIKKAGGAEQYHANKNYAEAVGAAAEACAEDTKGQTCFICTQALHWKTKEGLVRMCSCRGTAGIAHVSCLAEQAKILVADVEKSNFDAKVKQARWERWYTCSMCEQQYHGVVKCALGWACWKTYVGRPETHRLRFKAAMAVLGNGLAAAKRPEDALSVREAHLSTLRRLGAREGVILAAQSNVAITYQTLGRLEQALSMQRYVYSGRLNLYGEEHPDTVIAANNCANTLVALERFKEVKSLMRKTIPVARRVLDDNDISTLRMRWNYAAALYKDASATLDDVREAVTTLEETGRTARRVFGGSHPLTTGIECDLRNALVALRARETAEAP